MPDRVQDFVGMLKAALGDRVDQDAAGFVEMLATEAVMTFPFAPPGLPQRLVGASAIAEHLARLATLIAFDRIGPATVVAFTPDTTVIEFDASGRGLATSAPYEQRYISVIETRGGRITGYRDYWNPLVLLRALLGDEAMRAVDATEVYHG